MGRTGIGLVCLCLWTVGVVVRGQDDVNVATGKTYSQSSKYSTQGPPSKAANGDTSGTFPANCIHTAGNGDLTPWWEVDLGRTYPVNNISIWARARAKDRLYPSTITVGGETCATVESFPDDTREKRVTCSAVMYGQTVRITRRGTSGESSPDRTLNLCELEVWVFSEVSQCRAGSYGTSCNSNCNDHCGKGPGKNFCYQSSGDCYDGCVEGWYGAQCSTACSPGCPNNQCDEQTGQCAPCDDGYTGDKCAECKSGYYKTNSDTCTRCGSQCQSQNCDSPTGRCNGCVDGYYGDMCDTQCPTPNCQRCHQDTGECEQCTLNSHLLPPPCTECESGYYKTNTGTCHRCSSNCQSQSCDSQTGRCNGCVDGYYGGMCDTLCPTPNCQQCHRDTGECEQCTLNSHLLPPNCTECKSGYYKINASTCDSCGSNCQSQSCDSQTGKCNGCVDGYYGDMCDVLCQPNCQQCHQDTRKCEQCALNSHLLLPDCTECESGYYNITISACHRCGSNCQSQSCDSQTGKCNGCVDGYYGDMCDTLCPTPNCQRCHQDTGECEQCTPNSHLLQPHCTDCVKHYYKEPNTTECHECQGVCKSGTVCDKTTGYCPACPSGKEGHYCKQDAKGDDNIPVIVGAVVAVVFVIVIIVIIFVVLRKRKSAAKTRELESERANTAQNSGQQGQQQRAGSSPLSFAPVILSDDMKDAKPKAQVKAVSKPAFKPKPTSTGIYENVANVPAAQQHPASNSTSSPTAPSPHQNGTSKDVHRPMSEPMTDDEELEFLWSGEEPIYRNDPSYTNSVRVDQLQKVIVDNLKDGTIADEFKFMAGRRQYPLINAQRQENYYKNRFKSIVPYDKNRVVLDKVGDDDASDYINASYVKGYKTEKAYIAAQGPRSNTQDDFWRMVWQEGVTDIVMLTNVQEGIKPKCHEYWPAKGKSLNAGQVEVTGLEEEERAHFVIRTFSVQKLQGKEKRQVRQYHYVKWMDHEVPSTTPLVDFWHYVRARAPRIKSAPPLLVHCSAGVGRTGTYIALDVLIDQTQKEEEISFYQTVNTLRTFRCYMVQNEGQYKFLHEAVLEAYMSGDSRQDTSSFDRLFPNTIQHHLPNPRIDAEFERLCQMRTSLTPPSHLTARLEENRHKNRNPDAVPENKHLVYITAHTKGRNQYINAVYMPTFLSSRGSIVTQLPLADTVIDLWRLVDSWNVSTIVSIGQENEDKEGACQYWPKPKQPPMKSGAYTISLKSKTSMGEHLDSYALEMKKKDTSLEIRVLHYTAWTGEVADDVSDLIQLLDLLQASQTESTEEPVIIQCIDGVAKSGAVCVLWDVISRMVHDDDVDVYLAARNVHTVRPEAITSLVQYRFLYEVIKTYRASHSVYMNT